jgi:hypothetical protein
MPQWSKINYDIDKLRYASRYGEERGRRMKRNKKAKEGGGGEGRERRGKEGRRGEGRGKERREREGRGHLPPVIFFVKCFVQGDVMVS